VSASKEKRGERAPRHVAIIMDGNGRWARARGLARIRGHEEGANSVREITEECARLGTIEQLTFYALSYDNLHKRPKTEINALFKLLRKYLHQEFDTLMKNNIRAATIGEPQALPKYLQEEIAATVEKSSRNTGMRLCVALNYSARREITHAARELARLVRKGALSPEEITTRSVEEHLFTAGMPNVDLLIRSGGEMRVSDFLLWQISYAEIYVSDVCWPDFRTPQLHEALGWFGRRQRRFGAIEEN